jgi:hypothetical protein
MQESESPQELYVILAIRRGERAFPMSRDFQPRNGDIAAVALHEPDRDEALRLLGEMGWTKAE